MADLATLSIKVDSTDMARASRAMDDMQEKGSRLESAMLKMAGVFAGWEVGKRFIETNAEFERLNMRLVTLTQSQDKANRVFDSLQQFAATTPYSLREVTDAYAQLRARGMDPSTESMKSIGNAASALGVSLGEMVSAITGASAGQTEMLKHLGISAMTFGDKVRISYGGVSETVNKTSYDIEKAIIRISDRKFSGGMERQINTLTGAWSNLQDQIDMTFYAMGKSGANSTAVSSLQAITAEIGNITPQLVEMSGKAVSGLSQMALFAYQNRDALAVMGAAYMGMQLAPTVKKWTDRISNFSDELAKSQQKQLVYNSATMSYTVAAEGATVATRAWNSAISAMGGPLGLTLALLSAMGTAAILFKDDFKRASEKATEDSQKLVDQLQKEVELLKERRRLVSKGDSTGKNATDDEMEKLGALVKAAGDAQIKIDALKFKVNAYGSAGSSYAKDRMEAEIALGKEQKALEKLQGDYWKAKVAIQERTKLRAEDAAQAKAEADATSQAAREQAKKEAEAMKAAEEAARFANEKKEFIRHLKDEAKTYGMTSEELMKYRVETKYALGNSKEWLAYQERVDAKRSREAANANRLWAAEDHVERLKAEADARASINSAKLEFMFSEADAATRINDEDARTIAQKNMLVKLYADGNITAEQFKDRTVDLNKQLHVQTAIFGDLRDTIQNWSRESTDAFVEFCWGASDSFSKLIDSMLKDLARLAVQKQVMDPLWGYISQGITWLATSSYSDNYGSENQGENQTAANIEQMGSPVARSFAAPVQSSVVVNVNQANGSVDANATGTNGVALANMIKAQTLQIISDQKRQGGILAAR